MSEALLSVRDIAVDIQSMPALRGFSLELHAGEMVGLVGRNGAGKTTVLRSVMGHLDLHAGSISFDGIDLAGSPRHRRAALGIGYMPEDRALAPQLSVEENLSLPLWVSKQLDARERLALVYRLMPEVEQMRERRALAVGTRLLLLDEPFEGVAPALSRRLADVIQALQGENLAVLIAQSDTHHTRGVLQREVAIERGANAA